MPKNPPKSMQHHLRRCLKGHARERRPHVNAVTVRLRAGFAYVAAELPTQEPQPPWCRCFTTGLPTGSPEEALGCACGVHPGDPAGPPPFDTAARTTRA